MLRQLKEYIFVTKVTYRVVLSRIPIKYQVLIGSFFIWFIFFVLNETLVFYKVKYETDKLIEKREQLFEELKKEEKLVRQQREEELRELEELGFKKIKTPEGEFLVFPENIDIESAHPCGENYCIEVD